MNKLLLKISVYIYVLITIILGFISPILIGIFVYQFIKPNNYIIGALFVIVWIIMCFIVVIVAKYFYDKIRYRFKKIDNYIYEIENYIENQKYK